MSEEIPTEEFKLNENLNLGSEFSPPTFEEWKAQVEKDLKGASYEKKFAMLRESQIHKKKLRKDANLI